MTDSFSWHYNENKLKFCHCERGEAIQIKSYPPMFYKNRFFYPGSFATALDDNSIYLDKFTVVVMVISPDGPLIFLRFSQARPRVRRILT